MKNSQQLQQQVKRLTLQKDILTEKVKSQREIHSLKKEICNLGGDPIYNFKKDITVVLKAVWTSIFLTLGSLFDALDVYLSRFDEKEHNTKQREPSYRQFGRDS